MMTTPEAMDVAEEGPAVSKEMIQSQKEVERMKRMRLCWCH